LLACLVAGCRRTEPLDQPVSADSPQVFSSWKGDMRNRLSSQQWRDFDVATAEINFTIMTERRATGSAAIDEAMRSSVDGHTVREIVIMGYESKAARLRDERTTLEKNIQENARLRTRPNDTASADYLAMARQRQSERLAKVTAELAEAEDGLRRYRVGSDKK
jgi:hypothetical protein